jgi:hypothetical protein
MSEHVCLEWRTGCGVVTPFEEDDYSLGCAPGDKWPCIDCDSPPHAACVATVFAQTDPRDVLTTRLAQTEARLTPRSTPSPWTLRGCDKHLDRTDLPCYRVRDAGCAIVSGAEILARVLELEAQLRDAGVHVENGRTATCGQCQNTAFNVCTHLAFRELSDVLAEVADAKVRIADLERVLATETRILQKGAARWVALRSFVNDRRDAVGIRTLLAEMDRLEKASL